MEIQLRQREKVKIDSLKFGETFKLVDNTDVLQVIDVSGEAAFKDDMRTDVIYCSNLSRGDLEVLTRNLTVERVNLKVTEE